MVIEKGTEVGTGTGVGTGTEVGTGTGVEVLWAVWARGMAMWAGVIEEAVKEMLRVGAM